MKRRLGSIRWIDDGVARVEVEVGQDPVTGKRRRSSETVHGTQADAERVLARLLLESGKMPSGRTMSVSEYLEDIYFPSLKSKVRKRTGAEYMAKLRLHVIPQLGHIKLTDLQPYLLDRWRDELVAKTSGRNALHVYRAFCTALNRAVKWRLIETNCLLSVDAPKAQQRELETLTAGEASEYLKAFDGHLLEPLVLLAISTGLRPCELYALEWRDIDLKSASVRVRRGLHERSGEVWFEPPKSARSNRTVSLPAWVVEQLRQLRKLGPLVPDGFNHMRPTKIAYRYRKQLEDSGLRYTPLRDLRHTHATLLLEAGVDIVSVSRRLGHSTIAVTDAHYLRPHRSADEKAAESMVDLLAGNCGEAGKAGNCGEDMRVNGLR